VFAAWRTIQPDFVPDQIALMPSAYILGATGLNKSILGLSMVHDIQGISFTTLFARNFHVNIPDDLFKAGQIDGADIWPVASSSTALQSGGKCS
jgi:glucose/mannose transport system permease protein